ncbi:hypothetical protein [Pseudobacteroides cellulosolvens]|uniref:Uncharacterized protein n=1 Tax=Pseudobacteroides cellulosolvens ATCC 35603 = DSM 2933 TaxID=398512 RepID=A0A0L6JMF9_9FIRM|nr:hypothetical protein [Pseudobacteroides cellulosolvens]KNY26943.1 hypothetical protein Bccel_2208 [Pseudobacteroides cellulosolvens ATCC 35603 = DSM 2933]
MRAKMDFYKSFFNQLTIRKFDVKSNLNKQFENLYGGEINAR